MPRGESFSNFSTWERSKQQYKRKAELAGVSPDASFEEINQAFFDAQNKRLAELLRQEGIEIAENLSGSGLVDAVDAGLGQLGDKGVDIYRKVFEEFGGDELMHTER